MKISLATFLLWAAIPLFQVANAADAAVERLRSIVAYTEHETAPGCAIGIFRAGKPTVLTATGYANLEQRRLIDADTLFYAASVSKQFTALAVAKLAEAGKISLDDDVRRYLPELPQYQVPITIRMLLHHTAGIRDSLGLLTLAGMGTADKHSKEAVLQLVFRQQSTNFLPGSAYAYSNGGYLLLAEIVARASGMPFAAYAKREVLDPIGMKSSFFLDGPPAPSPDMAHGYVWANDKFEIRDTYPRFSGSGGLVVSMNDLARYEHDFEIGHKVWTAATRELLLQPGTLTNGDPALVWPGSSMAYGGGLEIGWRKGHRFIQHAGGAEAFRTVIARMPDRHLSVALLCNRAIAVEDKGDATIEAVEGKILRDPDEQLPGRYYSAELQAHYVLTLKDQVLSISIIPKGATQPASTWQFRKQGGIGRFRDGDRILTPLTNGFMLDSFRSSGLYFQRVAEDTARVPNGGR